MIADPGESSHVTSRIRQLLSLAANIRLQLDDTISSALPRDCVQRLLKVVRGEEVLLQRLLGGEAEPTAPRLASSNLHHIFTLSAALHHPNITSTSQVLHTFFAFANCPSHASHNIEPRVLAIGDSCLVPDGRRVSVLVSGDWVVVDWTPADLDSTASCLEGPAPDSRLTDRARGACPVPASLDRDASCTNEGSKQGEVAGSESSSCHVDAVCFLNHRLTWLVVGARKRHSYVWEDGGGTEGLQTRVRKLIAAARGIGKWGGGRERPETLALFFQHGLGQEVEEKMKAEFGAAHADDEGGEGRWLVVDLGQIGHPGRQMSGLEEGVNLDTTALVALVSELSNGAAPAVLAMSRETLVGRYRGMSDFVMLQAQSELERPLVMEMERQLDGKQVIVCQLAWSEFTNIVDKIAGPNEKARANELLTRLRVVQDQPSERVSSLQESGRIKMRHIIVAGTGDTLRIPTLTANLAVVRAADKAGVSLNIIQHRPRALLSQ